MITLTQIDYFKEPSIQVIENSTEYLTEETYEYIVINYVSLYIYIALNFISAIIYFLTFRNILSTQITFIASLINLIFCGLCGISGVLGIILYAMERKQLSKR